MSPVSSSKVSDPAAARVHAPFTLSETQTCSGALYWLNHPTSRSPWATGRVSVTVNAETRDPVENAVPWTKVGEAAAVHGRRAPKVAITAMLAAERVEGNFFTQTPVLYIHMRYCMSSSPTRQGIVGTRERPVTRRAGLLPTLHFVWSPDDAKILRRCCGAVRAATRRRGTLPRR